MFPMERLNSIQMDVLKELGNIGAGHAATALSQILYRPVDMRVPYVQIVPFDDVSEFVGGPEQPVTAILFTVEGDLSGFLFFIMAEEATRSLLNGLGISELEGDTASLEFSEMECSALNEIGNILAGSYLSSLANLTGLSMCPSVPALAIDMAGAIISYGLMEASQLGDVALVIDTNFVQGEKEAGGRFFFIPNPNSLPVLFKSLGVEVNEHH
jgi:chemotaxis protein CheC